MTKDKEKQKAYRIKHYRQNKQQYIDRNRKRRAELKKWIRDYKSDKCCEFCGEDHIACLDFHHKNSDTKERGVSSLIARGAAKKTILAEIKKCIVLCANCHRKVHWISE